MSPERTDKPRRKSTISPLCSPHESLIGGKVQRGQQRGQRIRIRLGPICPMQSATPEMTSDTQSVDAMRADEGPENVDLEPSNPSIMSEDGTGRRSTHGNMESACVEVSRFHVNSVDSIPTRIKIVGRVAEQMKWKAEMYAAWRSRDHPNFFPKVDGRFKQWFITDYFSKELSHKNIELWFISDVCDSSDNESFKFLGNKDSWAQRRAVGKVEPRNGDGDIMDDKNEDAEGEDQNERWKSPPLSPSPCV